ncbi:hypothetical protein GF327_04405 [Candidatus Woesearchaeota archaeon]|nr:hypothetical protein [Candidatus Woesearchaeota archaeon]
MGIQEDAGRLLVFVYQEYTKDNSWIDSKKVIETTKWNSGKINRAIMYLKDMNAIKINLFLGNTNGVYNFGINGLTPFGIQLVENSEEFKKNFGFKLDNPSSHKLKWD